MKRTNKDTVDYIEVRKKQLEEDRDKANNVYDKQWYNRLIQELDWAGQIVSTETTRNCFMEESNG
tara:strand:+ start:1072 stop:1266 length:195 start_codon:yes stop_codon:yes gene_type:complete